MIPKTDKGDWCVLKGVSIDRPIAAKLTSKEGNIVSNIFESMFFYGTFRLIVHILTDSKEFWHTNMLGHCQDYVSM